MANNTNPKFILIVEDGEDNAKTEPISNVVTNKGTGAGGSNTNKNGLFVQSTSVDGFQFVFVFS